MKRFLLGIALAACGFLPLAAAAQSGPPDRMGPPPEMRAKLDKMHADAKAASFNALSTDHRTKVQAIVGQVVAGTVSPGDGSKQIDTLLSADEKTNVFAVAKKMRDDFRTAMRGPGRDGPGGPPPGGPPPGGMGGPGGPGPGPGGPGPGAMGPGGPPPDGGRGMRRGAPSAGRYLLMISMTPEQMHALRPKRENTP